MIPSEITHITALKRFAVPSVETSSSSSLGVRLTLSTFSELILSKRSKRDLKCSMNFKISLNNNSVLAPVEEYRRLELDRSKPWARRI